MQERKIEMISIIVPIYNIEAYLEECIKSIIKQTYKELEIILVDDGSTDGSSEICDKFASQDKRIKVIHKQNEGLVLARKNGLQHAEGDYVLFVDGDDWIESNMCEELMKVMKQTDADIVHSGYFRGLVLNLPPDLYYSRNSYRADKFIRKHILNAGSNVEISFSIWSKLFRTPVIKKNYKLVPDHVDYGEDLLNLIICACEENAIVSIDKAYYHYRVRPDSISHVSEINNFEQEIELYEAIIKILKQYGMAEKLSSVTRHFFSTQMRKAVKRNCTDEFSVQVYKFPKCNRLIGKKVVLYGAGNVGVDYYSQICRISDCEIVLWVDAQKKCDNAYCEIGSMDDICQAEYDVIVVAVKSLETGKKIRQNLMEMGINGERILCEVPEYV